MKPLTVIADFTLAHMEQEPVRRRIELTLALAELAPTADEKDALLKHAHALREIETAHQQLVLNFRAARPAAEAMKFAAKIKALRLQRGLSQRALATALARAGLAISNPAIAGWEAGAAPRPDAAKKLAEFFGLTVEQLMGDSQEITEAAQR